jgi:hypothetical protein
MELLCFGEGEKPWLRGRNGWGWLEAKGEWEEEDDERRLGRTKTVGGAPLLEIGLGFFLYFSDVSKLPPLCVLKATIYRQNVGWVSKLVPQLPFL